MNHGKIFKTLSVFASLSIVYLFTTTSLDFNSFWSPLLIGFLYENGLAMPDIEFVEKMVKFLLGMLDR